MTVLKKWYREQNLDSFQELVYFLGKTGGFSLRYLSDELGLDRQDLHSCFLLQKEKINDKPQQKNRHSAKNLWKKKVLAVTVPGDGFSLHKPITGRVLIRKLDELGHVRVLKG